MELMPRTEELTFVMLTLLYFVTALLLIETAPERCSVCATNDRPNGVFNCSRCNFQQIPKFPSNAKKINLSHNAITTVFNSSFRFLPKLRVLDISNNNISIVSEDAFLGVRFLTTLNVSSNRITNEGLLSLQYTMNIEVLDISSNVYSEYPDSLASLTKLRTLIIDLFPGFHFDRRFETLTRLSDMRFNPRSHFRLNNETFEGLKNAPISVLDLNLPRVVLKPIGIKFLKPFYHLQQLHLYMRGRFDVKDILQMLYGLRHRKLDGLFLSNNGWDSPRHIKLTPKDIENLKTICVKKITLNYDYLLLFPFEAALNSTFSKCLEDISITRNPMQWTFSSLAALFSFPSIRAIDISVLPLHEEASTKKTNIQSKRVFYSEMSTFSLTLRGPNTLESFDMSGIFVYDKMHGKELAPLRIIAPRLKTLRLSQTAMWLCRYQPEFNTSLHLLDMSGWRCGDLNPFFFRTLKTLRYLNASKSHIGEGLKGNMSKYLLTGLLELEVLDLSDNEIDTFDTAFFEDQQFSLQNLYLKGNNFYKIPLAFRKLSIVIYVDLSDNEFGTFSKEDRIIVEGMPHTIFDFGGNVFDCSCRHIDSIVWMSERKHFFNNSNCIDGRRLPLVLDEIRSLQIKCISVFWLDFSVVSLLLLLLIMIAVTAGYRNKAVVVYFYMMARRFIHQQKADRVHSFKSDVFVSYTENDLAWVTSTFCPYLTNTLGLKVCIHHKDFIPGRPIAEEILRCIDESRKTAFIITKEFLKSEWSLFEMEIARRHVFQRESDTLIVILKDPIPVHKMPNVLKKIWWRVVCLKYPENDIEEEHKTFWSKLDKALGHDKS